MAFKLSLIEHKKSVNDSTWELCLRGSSFLEETVGGDGGEDSGESWHSWEGAGSIAAVIINAGIARADLK